MLMTHRVVHLFLQYLYMTQISTEAGMLKDGSFTEIKLWKNTFPDFVL